MITDFAVDTGRPPLILWQFECWIGLRERILREQKKVAEVVLCYDRTDRK